MKKNTAISCRNISKEYTLGKKYGSLRDTLSHLFTRKERATFMALDDVSFDIEKGSTVGLIGPNGAGKSTLLKILSRITAPTRGKAIINGRLSSLLEVGTGFHHELSGRENIYLNGSLLGMTRAEIKRKEAEIIDFSGVEKYIDTPVKHYSSGMYVRLAFAVAAQLDSDILLIDEVLAVGDQAFQKKSLDTLSRLSTEEGKTILLVSHNHSKVFSLCEKLIHLNKGQLDYYDDTDKYRYRSTVQNLSSYQLPIRNVHIFHNPHVKVELTLNKTSIRAGEPFFVEIKVVTEVELHDVRLIFGINNSAGFRVVTYLSDKITHHIPIKEEKVFQLPIQEIYEYGNFSGFFSIAHNVNSRIISKDLGDLFRVYDDASPYSTANEYWGMVKITDKWKEL